MKQSLDRINRCSEQEFVEILGGIFEHSPWVAELVGSQRPFESGEQLYQVMVDEVRRAPRWQRMDLLCQHPELAGKEASAGKLTRSSRNEQAGAGLDQCSAEELASIKQMNKEYRERFGFPFIIAVSGLDRQQIIDAMQRRLRSSEAKEFDLALVEVEKIARIRLHALLGG